MRKLGILQKETIVFIQGIPRRCILRDLSFSGAKVIMVGIAAFLVDKEVVVRIDIEEPRMAIGVKGKIVRTEDVEGRKDLVALAINYNDAEVPMSYKMHINNYLTQLRKTSPSGEENVEPAPAKAAAAAHDAPQATEANGATVEAVEDVPAAGATAPVAAAVAPAAPSHPAAK